MWGGEKSKWLINPNLSQSVHSIPLATGIVSVTGMWPNFNQYDVLIWAKFFGGFWGK